MRPLIACVFAVLVSGCATYPDYQAYAGDDYYYDEGYGEVVGYAHDRPEYYDPI